MSTLAELERAFARALDGDATGAADWVAGGAYTPEERLAVYRHNTDAILHQMLRAAYPAVERLAGADYLGGLIGEYRRAHPSRSGNLHLAGAALPAFLAERLAGSPYAFIADVARLEWAYQEVLVAADARAFDVARFASLPVEAHDGLVFRLAPSVRRVASAYPIEALWEREREATPRADAAEMDLAAGGDCLLLHRVGAEARIRRLDAATDAFVQALERGRALAAVVEALAAVDPARDPTALLFEFIQHGLIDDFQSV
jgi:Putative DNA-binding domain